MADLVDGLLKLGGQHRLTVQEDGPPAMAAVSTEDVLGVAALKQRNNEVPAASPPR